MHPDVRVLSYVRATDAEERSGLIGYLRVASGSLVIDGVTLRRTAAGRFALSFPERTDRSGRRHAIVRPVDQAAREAIERELLGQLGQGSAPPVSRETGHASVARP